MEKGGKSLTFHFEGGGGGIDRCLKCKTEGEEVDYWRETGDVLQSAFFAWSSAL